MNFNYISTTSNTATVSKTLHAMIQRGVDIAHVNGGKLTRACVFTASKGGKVVAPVTKKVVAKAKPTAKAVAKTNPLEKAKPAAKAKPVAKTKATAPKVSKYGTHPDGTIQFVPARGIYHCYVGGVIVAVKRDATKAKEELVARGIAVVTEVTFEG
jgi:hypothetical protein